MITVHDFIENEIDNALDDLTNHYRVQMDSKTKEKFIYSPFPNLDDILESFEQGLEDPWDDFEDEDNFDSPEIKQYIEECKELIKTEYEKTLQIRKDFAEKKGLPDYM